MEDNRRRKRYTLILFCISLIFSLFFVSYEWIGGSPSEFNISMGDEYIFQSRFPFKVSLDAKENPIVEIKKIEEIGQQLARSKGGFELKTLDNGTVDVELKLLGFVPYKTIKVNVVPKLMVIPGGQSIGVKLNTEGVLVVGIAEIVDAQGTKHNLAEQGGIRIGDSLLQINGKKVNNAIHVAEMIQESEGEDLELTLKRDGRIYTTSLQPILSEQDGEYKLGLWVRDKTAGVGTMTFYHPNSGKFGALGHAITDIDTGSLLSVKDGEIIKSRVASIQQGKRGKPGEIRGIFQEVHTPLGRLEKNTPFGVYGELFNQLENSMYPQAIPIAYQHEIVEGPAHILTTVENDQIEKFEIEIVKVNYQSKPNSKSMIIKVTDSRLIDATGGIVQGMSGSPILQNNKVVGAVTHVLVNDPTKGYGIFIEWMIEESGINEANY